MEGDVEGAVWRWRWKRTCGGGRGGGRVEVAAEEDEEESVWRRRRRRNETKEITYGPKNADSLQEIVSWEI